MFGLIRKRKILKILDHISNEYNDASKAPRGFGRNNYYHYCMGNINAANVIASKLGHDMKVLVKQ